MQRNSKKDLFLEFLEEKHMLEIVKYIPQAQEFGKHVE